MGLGMKNISSYFGSLTTTFYELPALFGFMIFFCMINQLISGTMLAFSLMPEVMLMPMGSEEEDSENLYIDDFFWLHERGVDFIFIFTSTHLSRKLYLNFATHEKSFAWKSGAFLFLVIQVVVFSGLVLCTTHLSEITLAIASNIIKSLLYYLSNLDWLIFTDGTMNTDTLVRVSYGHYLGAFFLSFLGLTHGMDMHYAWQSNNYYEGLSSELSWQDEVMKNEMGKTLEVLLAFWLVSSAMYKHTEPLAYEHFTWADVGMMNDVRFYSVSPHWYFSPYMAWLLTCPYHYLGVFGLIFFFMVFYFQVNVMGWSSEFFKKLNSTEIVSWMIREMSQYKLQWDAVQMDSNVQWQSSFMMFFFSYMYMCSYLPYGSFYQYVGGNFVTLVSYLYVYVFLSLYFVSNSWIYSCLKLENVL